MTNKFLAISLSAATALTPLAAVAQTDQSAVPSMTAPADAAKQSMESQGTKMKNKANKMKTSAQNVAHKKMQNMGNMTTNPADAVKPPQ
jgi:hypothetical protein